MVDRDLLLRVELFHNLRDEMIPLDDKGFGILNQRALTLRVWTKNHEKSPLQLYHYLKNSGAVAKVFIPADTPILPAATTFPKSWGVSFL